MSVRGIDPQPAIPVRGMNDDADTMNLRRGRKASPAGLEFLAELPPTLHNDARRLVGCKSKAAAGARRREGSNAERGEVVDGL